MEFILDQYYFNRNGDKVKYVGNYATRHDYAFRDLNGFLFYTNSDGKLWPAPHSFDVLGSWEINSDPERVYIDKFGFKHRIQTAEREPNEYYIKSNHTIDDFVKILIKPVSKAKEPKTYTRQELEEELRAAITSKNIPNYIEPLATEFGLYIGVGKIVLKLNQIINRLNGEDK